MPQSPILPRAADVIFAGKRALRGVRPRAFEHANLERSGAYERVFKGWENQVIVNLARVADEAKAVRLGLATGDPLRQTAASEYRARTTFDPTNAIGSVEMTRTGTDFGRIPAGTRFARSADPTTAPPTTGSSYESTNECVVPAGVQVVTVPIRAVTAGPDGNIPIFDIFKKIELVDVLFDKTFVTTFNTFAAGGDVDISDPALRLLSLASYSGDNAPVDTALALGAILAGARHVATFQDPESGAAQIACADASWAYSDDWGASIKQSIVDNQFLGFGCRADVIPVKNTYVAVTPIIMLRSGTYLSDTREIDAAVRAALLSYFDDRSDWYKWTDSGIRAVISHAHVKILTCETVTVSESDGTPLYPPPTSANRLINGLPLDVRHFHFADQGLNASYLPPS